MIATYGNAPSGFNGSGNTVSGGNSGYHDSDMKPVHDTILYDSTTSTWSQDTSYFQQEEPGATGIAMDPIEVTNGLWDDVVTWATQNGYTGLGIRVEN